MGPANLRAFILLDVRCLNYSLFVNTAWSNADPRRGRTTQAAITSVRSAKVMARHSRAACLTRSR